MRSGSLPLRVGDGGCGWFDRGRRSWSVEDGASRRRRSPPWSSSSWLDVDRLVACLRSLAAASRGPLARDRGRRQRHAGRDPRRAARSGLAGRRPLTRQPRLRGGCNWGARFARGGTSSSSTTTPRSSRAGSRPWSRWRGATAGSERSAAGCSGLTGPCRRRVHSLARRRHPPGGARPSRGFAGIQPVRHTDYCSGCGLLVTREAWGRSADSTRGTSPPTTRTSTSASRSAPGASARSTRPTRVSSTTGAPACRTTFAP